MSCMCVRVSERVFCVKVDDACVRVILFFGLDDCMKKKAKIVDKYLNEAICRRQRAQRRS